MKETVSLKMVVLHVFSFGIILMLGIASPSAEFRGFTVRNPANWVIILFLTVLMVWQYIWLSAAKEHRHAVWIFSVLGIILILIGWYIIITMPRVESIWEYSGRKTSDLLFVYAFLCPPLLSSCTVSWGVAPSFAGKMIFTIAILVSIAMGIHLCVLSESIDYLPVMIWLIMMGLVLYLMPKKSKLNKEERTDETD